MEEKLKNVLHVSMVTSLNSVKMDVMLVMPVVLHAREAHMRNASNVTQTTSCNQIPTA